MWKGVNDRQNRQKGCIEMIVTVKVKGKTKYRVITHQTGKNMGTYKTRAAAKKRLAQIARFR